MFVQHPEYNMLGKPNRFRNSSMRYLPSESSSNSSNHDLPSSYFPNKSNSSYEYGRAPVSSTFESTDNLNHNYSSSTVPNESYSSYETIDYSAFWIIVVIALIGICVVAYCFRRDSQNKERMVKRATTISAVPATQVFQATPVTTVNAAASSCVHCASWTQLHQGQKCIFCSKVH